MADDTGSISQQHNGTNTLLKNVKKAWFQVFVLLIMRYWVKNFA